MNKFDTPPTEKQSILQALKKAQAEIARLREIIEIHLLDVNELLPEESVTKNKKREIVKN